MSLVTYESHEHPLVSCKGPGKLQDPGDATQNLDPSLTKCWIH